jgi:hypothetical protein
MTAALDALARIRLGRDPLGVQMSAFNPECEADAGIDDAAAREHGASEARRLLGKVAQLLQGADISPPLPCARAGFVDIGPYPACGPERAPRRKLRALGAALLA